MTRGCIRNSTGAIVAAVMLGFVPAGAQATENELHLGTETEAEVVTCREPIHAKMMANAVDAASARFSVARQSTMAWLIDTRKCSARRPVVIVPKKPLQLGPPHVVEAFVPDRRETLFVVTGARIMRDDQVIAESIE